MDKASQHIICCVAGVAGVVQAVVARLRREFLPWGRRPCHLCSSGHWVKWMGRLAECANAVHVRRCRDLG